jgi:hypothetical protein
MINDKCGILISVDSERDLPDPVDPGKLYFVKSSGDIIGDLGNGATKYSDTLFNRPDLWERSEYYNFNNRLIGVRLMGTVPDGIGKRIIPLIGNAKSIVECGGMVPLNGEEPPNDSWAMLNTSLTLSSTTYESSLRLYTHNTLKTIVLEILVGDDRSFGNNEYDIWFKYKA